MSRKDFKDCGSCLHRGEDGNSEPCKTCLEGAKHNKVFSGWKCMSGMNEEELRKRSRKGK